MKKVLLALLLAAVFHSTQASTPTNNLPFAAEEPARIEQEMAGLQQLENEVTTHNLTYSDLVAQAHPLLSVVSPAYSTGAALVGSAAPDERLLGIPGFFWGCCFGVLGIVLMYVAIEDPKARKREANQAMVGCAIATIFSVALYLIGLANVE